jgi:hypothetical protein
LAQLDKNPLHRLSFGDVDLTRFSPHLYPR